MASGAKPDGKPREVYELWRRVVPRATHRHTEAGSNDGARRPRRPAERAY